MEDHCEPVKQMKKKKKKMVMRKKDDNIYTFEPRPRFIFILFVNYIDILVDFLCYFMCPNRVGSQHITLIIICFFGHINTSLFLTVLLFRFIDHFYYYYTCLPVIIKNYRWHCKVVFIIRICAQSNKVIAQV